LDPEKSPALYFMACDVVRQILERATDVPELSAYVTSTFRDLTGARCVCLLMKDLPGRPGELGALAASPESAQELFTSERCSQLRDVVKPAGRIDLSTLEGWQTGTGYASALYWPLALSGETFGAVCLLDPPEGRGKDEQILAFLEPVGAVLALALHPATGLARQKRLLDENSRSLERTVKLYGKLFDCAPYAIALADVRTGTLRRVNLALADLAGRSIEELEGHSHKILHPPEPEPEEAELRAGFRAQVVTDGRAVAEEVIRRPDGELRQVEVRSTTVDLDGEPHLLGFFNDVTDRRAAEDQRRLLQDQLAQSQKMEALGTLAGGIAHDFNNVLSAILGYTELTYARLPPDSLERADLAEVLKASARARELVKRILAFSRKAAAGVKPVEVGAVVGEALRALRPLTPPTVELEVSLDPATGRVRIDPTQIHQVVTSLFENAVYAMRERGGRLAVDLRRVSVDEKEAAQVAKLRPGEFARLTVADAGTGIAPEVLHRIFEPFFTTKPSGEGTGMGLSAVHGVARQSGGAVAVETEAGKGATFRVWLPIHAEKGEEGKAEPAVTHGTGRVLVVDDEPVLAQVMTRMISRLGYEVTSKASGAEALEAFRAQPLGFDAVVTDQTMPHLSGVQLSREIQALRPGTPVVLCSGFTDAAPDPAEVDAAGIGAVLTKPIELAKLGAELARLVVAARKAREAAT
jgi:PAS domain S-box-containing protein